MKRSTAKKVFMFSFFLLKIMPLLPFISAKTGMHPHPYHISNIVLLIANANLQFVSPLDNFNYTSNESPPNSYRPKCLPAFANQKNPQRSYEQQSCTQHKCNRRRYAGRKGRRTRSDRGQTQSGILSIRLDLLLWPAHGSNC